jgi:thiol-disulfide isomerase/thioredoxin
MPHSAVNRRTLLTGIGSSLLLSATATKARAYQTASPWGDLELLDADDRSFRVNELPKPLTLIKLWANWCSVCLRELDSVARIEDAVGAANIDIILVSNPEDWARNQHLARARGLTIRSARPSADNPVSAIRDALFAKDGMYYVPRSVLFSKARQAVVWNHVGGVDWSDPGAVEPLRRWIA